MRFLSCLLLLNIFSFFGFCSALSDDEKTVNSVVAKIAKKLEKKYNIKAIGDGGGIDDDGVRMMSLSFQIKQPLERNEARRLIISGAQDFLADINANKEIRPYLKIYPFKNIELCIFSVQSNGRDVYDPYIGVVAYVDGELGYRTNDRDNPYRYKSKYFETLDEALAILAMKIMKHKANNNF